MFYFRLDMAFDRIFYILVKCSTHSSAYFQINLILSCMYIELRTFDYYKIFKLLDHFRYHIPREWLQDFDNLLVLFEETGGDPLKISLKTHSTKTICAEVAENHYPPLSAWSHPDVINGIISINKVAPEVHLRCDEGHVISSITFASYGTPNGSCQKFSRGNCHAPSSLSVVTKV